MRNTKSYSELMKLDTFEERLEYLYIGDCVGRETFGNARILNQKLYKSTEWIRLRDHIIVRDLGCDLGVEDCELMEKNVIIHHINPIDQSDIVNRTKKLFDPENLITTSLDTHNKIHYGQYKKQLPTERKPNDTCPWKT